MAYDGPDRRATDRRSATRYEVLRRFESLEGRMTSVESDVFKLENAIIPRVQKIDEVHEILTAAKGAFTVLTWLGKGAKPVIWIVIAIGGILGIKTGISSLP